MGKNIFNIYTISDPHFGHGAHHNKGGIILHANRPFKSVEEMDAKLISNWNRQVRPQDVIIVPGDLIWTQGAAEKIKEYIRQLNGRIILVMGNHDKKGYSWYMANGIQFVCDRFTWEFNGKRILFIHDPLNVSIEDKERYQYIIHGHLHQNAPLVRKVGSCIFVNVSIENLNYTPINLITLLSRLTQGYFEKK